MKVKCFTYLRVSGHSQLDKDGFPRQRDSVNRYAKRYGLEIEREFVEKAVSGTKESFDREALTDLFVALKSNGVRLVLVETASRLARDLMVGEILLREFRKIGVKVISAECGTDLTVEDDEPTKKLIRQVLGAVSEWQKSIEVQKLRAARMRMKKVKGYCEGRKPYGVTDAEQAIIKLIKEQRQAGKSFIDVAKHLNETGVKPRKETRAGKAAMWHPTMIQRILARH